MKPILLFFTLLLLASSGSFAQNIAFTDLKLKAFLVNEICSDTNQDSIPDATADANADGEIQVSEALGVVHLEFEDFSAPRYWIKSVADLSHFENLQRLILIHNDSLAEFSHLGLDSLTFATDERYLKIAGHRTAALEDSRLLPIEQIDAR
jgi:hypothetical protein